MKENPVWVAHVSTGHGHREVQAGISPWGLEQLERVRVSGDDKLRALDELANRLDEMISWVWEYRQALK